MEAPQKTKNSTTHDPAMPFLGIYPKGSVILQRYQHTHVHGSSIHNSHIIESPRCLSTNKWIKTMWCICTMEYYLVLKKDDVMSFVGKCMELEIIMLSKISQAQKVKSHALSVPGESRGREDNMKVEGRGGGESQ